MAVFRNDDVGGDDDIIVFEDRLEPPPIDCKLDVLLVGDDDDNVFVGLFTNINDVEKYIFSN